MSVLNKIVASVRESEAAVQREISLEKLLEKAHHGRGQRRSLLSALEAPERVHIIAEIKRASPSKGVIAADLDPVKLTRAYEEGGAAAISVLTEPNFFRGSSDDLVMARSVTSLPVLRKDFILSEYAVAASAALGADAILLIVRLLDAVTLRRLYSFAHQLGMECLVEVHDESDLRKLSGFCPSLVGINNRDLASFETDTGKAVRLAGKIGAGAITIALSGVADDRDVATGCQAGVTRFLIGEALAKSDDPAVLLRSMLASGKEALAESGRGCSA